MLEFVILFTVIDRGHVAVDDRGQDRGLGHAQFPTVYNPQGGDSKRIVEPTKTAG